MRPRRSRTPAPSKPARSKRSTRRAASRSPARRSKTICVTCGRSSISSIRGCSARRRRSRLSSSGSPIGRRLPTRRCASSCAPYILRRLKTDRSVIADLPDKTEVRAFCRLSRKQAALYQTDGRGVRKAAGGIGRRDGAAWAGAGDADALEADLQPRLALVSAAAGDGDRGQRQVCAAAEIAATVASRQEKMLVFTQFKEAVEPLGDLLPASSAVRDSRCSGDTAVARAQDAGEYVPGG